MSNHNTARQKTCAADFLDVLLQQGIAPKLNELLLLAPFEPYVELEVISLDTPEDIAEAHRLKMRARALRAEFPGYQADRRIREDMKFGRFPLNEAPLSPWVRTLLYHAMSKWCVAIDTGRTKKQFRDWLPEYLEDDNLCWSGSPGLDAARQILRMSCGLARFPSTRRVP